MDNSINVSFEAATQTEADAMRIPVVIPTSDSNLSLLQAENSSVSEKEYRRQISALRMELKVAQSKIFEMEEDREMVSLEVEEGVITLIFKVSSPLPLLPPLLRKRMMTRWKS